MTFSDRERELLSRRTAELSRLVPPPSHFLSIARDYSLGKISALRYSEKDGGYIYYDLNTKKRHFLPSSEFQERVEAVCRREDGTLYFKPVETLPGVLGAAFNDSVCSPDPVVGVVHTHPAGAVFPSGEDLLSLGRGSMEVMCVGTKQRVNGKDVYPVACFYRYPWVDEEDVRRVYSYVNGKLASFMKSKFLENTLRVDVYDKHGIRYVYIFPPPAASRYLFNKLREDPVVSSVFDIDFRVWDESDLE